MKISDITKEIENHPTNAWANKKGWKPLFTASAESRVVVIGQAPGRKAQESGIPWDDVSGKRLKEWLGVTDAEFYDETKISLLPMDFYFPGSIKGKSGDLPPRKEFAPMWHQRILDLMPDVELIVLIGQYSQKYYLAESMERNLTETVRNYKEYLKQDPALFPIPHPSPLNGRWLVRNDWFESDILPEIKVMVRKAI